MSFQFLGSNTLIWQPDTRISTFPSGLVLVQRSAICRNTYLTTARGAITLNAELPCESPSTVTVYQFPKAQEIHQSDGFVRFDVSGYGYYGTGSEKTEYAATKIETTQLIYPRIIKSFVVPLNGITNPFNYAPTTAITIRNIIGATVTISGSNWALDGQDNTSFGQYEEVSISFSPRFTLV